MNDISTRIKDIIINVLNLGITIDELENNNLIETYGINSVDALEILIHIENEFDIEIEEENLNAELISSVSILTDYVSSRLQEESGNE